jgi:hypothetical protein
MRLPGNARYELKFKIPVSLKEALLESIRLDLNRDPKAGPEGTYRVSSLYYDSPQMDAYWEKLDGVLYRRKFRLRYYGRPSEMPEAAFMEIKHRHDKTVSKERIRLAPEGAGKLLGQTWELSRLSEAALRHEASTASVSRIVRAFHNENLRPAVVVTYIREPWVGIHDTDLRVTFDMRGEAHGPSAYLAAGLEPGHPFMAKNEVILEVKFDRFLPRWLQQRLIAERLRPVRFSKYAEAMDSYWAAGEMVG